MLESKGVKIKMAKTNRFEPFGSDIPFAEPQWYRGLPTPYYNGSHVELRVSLCLNPVQSLRIFYSSNV